MDSEDIVEKVLDKGKVELYGESAEFYDLTYSEAMANSSKERSARKYLDDGDKVLDLASGTGIVTGRLESDFDVTGVDISREMLEVARDKNLESFFIQGDMTDLPFYQEFDAVVMYGQPLSHLENTEDVRSAASSIYEALKPKGVMVTDVFSAEAGRKDGINSIEVTAGDYTILMSPEFSNYDPENQTWEGSIRFSIQSGQAITVLEDSHQFRGYSLNEIEEIMKDAGFEGVKDEEIFNGDLSHGIMAYKGGEPDVTSEPGFFL